MSPSALQRYRAERLLRKDFAGLRSKVLSVVRSQLHSKGVALDYSDLEACYAQAFHGLYATVLDGETVENPSAWLILVTFRRAIDESRAATRIHVGGGRTRASASTRDGASKSGELGKSREPRKSQEPAASIHGGDVGSRAASSDPDLAGSLDDRTRLRHLFEGLRTRLSPRECEVASLCYLQGLSRAEAASQMGVSEARIRKLMEGSAGRPGVAGKVGSLLDTIKHGGYCEQQSSLMRAFAFGILDPDGERHALAVAHCRECPACRAYVASLRGLASVLPLPLLRPLAFAGGTSAAGAGAGAGAGASGGASANVGATGAGAVSAGGAGAGVPTSATGATAGAWSGFAGSLAPKLAVMALIALGGGYALLENRAHGNPPARHVAAPRLSAGKPSLAFPLTTDRRLVRARRSPTSPRSHTHTHAPAARISHPRSHLATFEFAPERTSSEAKPTLVHSSPPVGEFGIE